RSRRRGAGQPALGALERAAVGILELAERHLGRVRRLEDRELRLGGADPRRERIASLAVAGRERLPGAHALPRGNVGGLARAVPRRARRRPRELGAVDLREDVGLHGLEVLTRGGAPRYGLAHRPLVLVEQRQLEGHADRALLRNVLERVLARPARAPGVSRRDVQLRPAL